MVGALSCGTKSDAPDASAAGSSATGGNATGGNATGGNATGGTENPFVVPWTCPYTTNSGFMASTKMVFSVNADGTLSSTSMINTTPCSLNWTTSGLTATAVSGQMCGSFEVTSYTFKLEGDVAFFIANAIQHGMNVAADGTTTPIDIAGSFSGFCTNDNKANATVTPLCEADPVIGCGANRAGYLCLGIDSPAKLDSALSCPNVFTGGAACCTLGPGASTCQPDSTVSCTGETSGYSCRGIDTPAQQSPVVCEPGKPRGSETTYCCGNYASPNCEHSTTIAGCPEYAFSCTGAAKPWDADNRIRCGQGSASGDSTLFCCSVRDPASPNTCAPDPTVPCETAIGYSCTGSDAPSDGDPSLICGEPAAYEGMSLYCCEK